MLEIVCVENNEQFYEKTMNCFKVVCENLKPKLPALFDQVDVVSFFFFFFGWLVIYVACDNLFKYSNNAAQFFILAVLWSRFPAVYFVA